jgi:DNA-binding transcriptional LysR family regulator
VELRHLRYFVAVAEELHFRRAAARLHISQPPLSQQIRALERELGTPLLARNRRRVELTAAGEVFLREAREVLGAVHNATELTRRVGRGEVGRLSVGFVGSAMYATLPEILRAFRTRYPNVDLNLRELTTAAQLEALDAGWIDVGFIRPPSTPTKLAIETIHREGVVVALPDSHPLAGRRRLRLQDLRDEALVVLAGREAPGLQQSLDVAMTELRGGAIVQEVAEINTAIGLVVAGLGISFVPASVAALEREGVAYRPLSGVGPTVELALAWRPAVGSPVLERFLEVARGGPTKSNAPGGGERLRGGAAG